MNHDKENQEILKRRTEEYNKIPGARVGDYLKLPNGKYTRFTYGFDDHIQTGGHGNGFYLGNGYISYSGGLDPGVKLSDITQTEQTKKGFIWFFDNDFATGGNGRDFEIDFRVFKLKPDADLSGLHEYLNREIDTPQKIKLINGNNQEYKINIPQVEIMTRELNEVCLKHIKTRTGLTFEKAAWSYKSQPKSTHQIVKLLLTYNFKTLYQDNNTFRNTLQLTFNQE